MGDHVIHVAMVLCMFAIRTTVSLECFSCLQARNLSTCHQTRDCGSGDVCYTELVSNGSDIIYNLGCRPLSQCGSGSSDSVASLVGRSTESKTSCNHCCGSNYCNKNLCTDLSVLQPNVCHDDPLYNCALVAASFNICSDVAHAKKVCKKHCGLCSIVDGFWAPWSGWSQCDASCEQGLKLRMRTCTDPAPANGGSNCVGDPMETGNCTFGPCPVNGAWSSWAAWSQCDRSCDMGQRLRLRFCNSPSPANNGKDCPGEPMEMGNCTIKHCPVEGGWTDWGGWSFCDRTCGAAQRMRMRSCTKPAPAYGGKTCGGNQMEIGECPNVPTHCPVDGGWSLWSTWTDCSTTCGAGLHNRHRNCSNPVPAYNGKPCFGDSQEYKVCVQQACANGGWSVWSTWGACSMSCDGGLMSRVRSCDNPHTSTYGKPCDGQDMEYVTCNRQNCPVQAVFFSVDTPHDLHGSSTGGLAMNNIITNEGHGYSKRTGDFKAPIAGIYHVTLTASTSHRSVCHLVHNHKDVVSINTHDSSQSSSAYVQLAAGDIVNVRCDGGMHDVGSGTVLFSGALVMKT